MEPAVEQKGKVSQQKKEEIVLEVIVTSLGLLSDIDIVNVSKKVPNICRTLIRLDIFCKRKNPPFLRKLIIPHVRMKRKKYINSKKIKKISVLSNIKLSNWGKDFQNFTAKEKEKEVLYSDVITWVSIS